MGKNQNDIQNRTQFLLILGNVYGNFGENNYISQKRNLHFWMLFHKIVIFKHFLNQYIYIYNFERDLKMCKNFDVLKF